MSRSIGKKSQQSTGVLDRLGWDYWSATATDITANRQTERPNQLNHELNQQLNCRRTTTDRLTKLNHLNEPNEQTES